MCFSTHCYSSNQQLIIISLHNFPLNSSKPHQLKASITLKICKPPLEFPANMCLELWIRPWWPWTLSITTIKRELNGTYQMCWQLFAFHIKLKNSSRFQGGNCLFSSVSLFAAISCQVHQSSHNFFKLNNFFLFYFLLYFGCQNFVNICLDTRREKLVKFWI